MEKKFRKISFIFLLGCVLFYGIRFVYYYKKFNSGSSNNKEGATLAFTLQKNNGLASEGDGLYTNEGELVFRGTKVNNYLLYSNILWRIVKVNTDNSVMLITNAPIANLAYSKEDSEYLKSDIFNWLNKSKSQTGYLESILSNKKDFLVPNTLCLDAVNNLSNITCHKKDNENYVGLLTVADYLNSKLDDSYINNTDSIWTSNSKDEKTAWVISDGNLSNDSITNMHGVKAVITLKNSIGKVSGNGTKEKPYKIEKDDYKLKFNSYVKLGNDTYTVLEKNDKTIKLVNTDLVNDSTSRYYKYYEEDFDVKQEKSIAYYLNNKYLDSLSYKNKLTNCTFYVGEYNDSYKDVFTKKVSAKVGLMSVSDINLNTKLTNYLLLNKYNKLVLPVTDGKQSYANKVRPVVCIKADTKLKGNGTSTEPFELEG